jgi:hypothetical protein
MLFSSIVVRLQGRKGIGLERHFSECAAQREIEKIYGRYKMFDLARS